MTKNRSLLVITLWVIALSILAGYIFLIVSEKKTIPASWFTTQVIRVVMISTFALIVGIQFGKLQKNNLTPNEKKRAARSFYFALFISTTVTLLSIIATPAAPVSAELKNVATTSDMMALRQSLQKNFEQGTKINASVEALSRQQEARHRHVDAKLATVNDAVVAADKGAQARHYAVAQSIDTVNSRLIAVADQLEVLPNIRDKVDTLEGQLKEIKNVVSKDTNSIKSFRWSFIVLVLSIAGVLATLSWFSSKTDWGNTFVPPKWRTYYIPRSFIAIGILVSIVYFLANSELKIGSIKEIVKKDTTISKSEPKQEKTQDPPVVAVEEEEKKDLTQETKPLIVQKKKEDIPKKSKKFFKKNQAHRKVVRAPYPWM